MPKRKAEVMPNRRAKASTRALPKACFRGCGPGQLLLTEEEFKMVQKELARIGEERHFKFELVPMSDVKEPPKKTKQKAAKPQSKPSASSATKRRTEEVSGTAPKRRRRRREHTQEDETMSPMFNEGNNGNEETEFSEMARGQIPGGEDEELSPMFNEGNNSNEETESSDMDSAPSQGGEYRNELDELLEQITEAQVAIVGKAFNLIPEGPECVAVLDIDNFSTRKRRRLKKMLEDMVKENNAGQDGQNDQAAATPSPQPERRSPPAPIPSPVTTAPPVTSAASGSAAPAGSAAPEETGEPAMEVPAEPQQNSAEDDEELRKFLDECDEWM